MSEFESMKMWRRAVLLAAGILLLSNAICAQDVSQEKSALRTSGKSLESKLKVLTPTVCIGSPLKLRLEVTNVGQETVKLNRAYFWNSYTLYPSAQEDDEEKETYMGHVWPRSTSEDIFFLAPGATHVAHSYWSPYQKVSEPGNYTLAMGGYGKRNRVRFELRDCKPKGN